MILYGEMKKSNADWLEENLEQLKGNEGFLDKCKDRFQELFFAYFLNCLKAFLILGAVGLGCYIAGVELPKLWLFLGIPLWFISTICLFKSYRYILFYLRPKMADVKAIIDILGDTEVELYKECYEKEKKVNLSKVTVEETELYEEQCEEVKKVILSKEEEKAILSNLIAEETEWVDG